MLYYLSELFSAPSALTAVYLRMFLAFMTAVILSLCFGEKLIAVLHHHQAHGQPIREDGPQTHLAKKGTPTMGGLMILGSGILSTVLWAHWNDPLVWVCILVLLVYGFVGFVDDYVKVKNHIMKTSQISL